ncbi:hypothetical protein LCGC14_1485970 [marine sediment metagenome]|uniref:Uncharacterized protein n=1 Tax=marine sediment metagenome TaxID=412755 RepID=A0A0F9LNS0_9ZZZZ
MLNSQLNQNECQNPSQSQSNIPDSIVPVIAWKVWVVGASDLALYSCYYPEGGPWTGKRTADGASRVGRSFHAFKKLEEVSKWARAHCGPSACRHAWAYPPGVFLEKSPHVRDYRIGQVVLWGHIVEYEDGYLAEFAMRRDEWERTENFT